MVRSIGNSYKIGLENEKTTIVRKIRENLEEINYKINNVEPNIRIIFKGNIADKSVEHIKNNIRKFNELENR